MTTNIEPMPNRYRIGAVSRLTGIPTDTLRMWERRYGVVEPTRTEKGGRLYSQEDVTRLTLIKTLVDRGHAIGTVARLSDADLRQRLAQTGGTTPAPASDARHRVCIVGEALALRVRHAEALPESVEIAGSYKDLKQFREDQTRCDLLILELPFLDMDKVRQLQHPELRERAGRILVVYAFAPSVLLKQLQRLQIDTERAPVSVEHLWQHLLVPARGAVDTTPLDFDPSVITTEPAPPRIFSTAQLAALSGISTTLKCECPHHLSSMIETLSAFEEYSTRCENESRQDAALHAYLHVMTAKARWLMEIALEKLIEVEGLDADGNHSAPNDRPPD